MNIGQYISNGDATVVVSTVRRWVRRCKEAEGQTKLADETRSGRPAGDCFLPADPRI